MQGQGWAIPELLSLCWAHPWMSSAAPGRQSRLRSVDLAGSAGVKSLPGRNPIQSFPQDWKDPNSFIPWNSGNSHQQVGLVRPPSVEKKKLKWTNYLFPLRLSSLCGCSKAAQKRTVKKTKIFLKKSLKPHHKVWNPNFVKFLGSKDLQGSSISNKTTAYFVFQI